MLGDKRVLERTTYDHVGIKACLYDSNDRVSEKICKGRRAFNACSGVGVRKNGLSMKACNIIFWGIVIPTVTFGSELWALSEKDYDDLCLFQRQLGRRIQRFPARSPSCSSFYGLGWLRITTYILVKKLLFALSILRLAPENIVRQIFIMKVNMFHENKNLYSLNVNRSPTFDNLNQAAKAGVYNMLYDMTTGKKHILSKSTWSKMVWAKAWQLDEMFWRTTDIFNTNNDLLNRLNRQSMYLPWWDLSDSTSSMIGICEAMARLVCHASRLKVDDQKLKSLTPSHKMCSNCSMYVTEDLFHILMQCPHNEKSMKRTFFRIIDIDPCIKAAFEGSPNEVFNWMIGKEIPNVDRNLMHKVWMISGGEIVNIYKRICRERSGVG